jgi:hypothetical protein
LALDHAFPTSLTPIQIPMRVFDAVRELEGRGDRFFVKRETWSISERTCGLVWLYERSVGGDAAGGEVIVQQGGGGGGVQEVGYPLVFVNEYLERRGGGHGHCSHLR